MSGAPKVRSMNVDDPEARPVLVPAGNKTRSVTSTITTRKPGSKPLRKAEAGEEEKKKKDSNSEADPKSLNSNFSAGSVLRRQEWLLHSNLSLNASCSSDASTDSFCSRASTGRIGRAGIVSRRRPSFPRPEKKILGKVEKIGLDGGLTPPPEQFQGKRRCAWVTPNSDPSYVAFHDEEWGVPVHDDKKLFELLVLSGALAELSWPAILCRRHMFREIFMEFDPALVSKLNEKKLAAPGSPASSLLSEPKLRAIIENARQTLKITEEFGSFDRYCWSFVNQKPIVSRFRYSRQVPVKTPKADVISKDLMRRGFRSVGPTVIYSFMQAAGLTNDHLITCYRFEECAADVAASLLGGIEEGNGITGTVKQKMEGGKEKEAMGGAELSIIDLELSRAVEGLSVLSS